MARLRCGVGGRGAPPAFTLIELLVVIAIIAILVALLLTSISEAKSLAQSLKCKSNLRQLGVGLSSYVHDYQSYPVYNYDSFTDQPTMYWHTQLTPYTAHKWLDPLYRCPAYKGASVDGNDVAVPLGSYGYNANGVKYPLSDLGLGGIYSKIDPDGNFLGASLAEARIPENKILVPSDMIAIGDATLVRLSSAVIDLLYGVKAADAHTGMALLDINVRNRLANPKSAFRAGYQAANRSRHNNAENIVLCDGHVEAPKEEKLYDLDDLRLKRWNSDHQPHADQLLP